MASACHSRKTTEKSIAPACRLSMPQASAWWLDAALTLFLLGHQFSPAEESPMFVRNAWYVAAFDYEVGRQLLARTILDQRLVFYRTRSGQPVALEDRCAHRFLPLSKG